MLYTRSDASASTFEPQRNLMTRTFDLDGGGSVAADALGDVFVAWHGRAKGDADTEVGRQMWVARSTDDGATFAPEQPAFKRKTGACGCCGTRALADRRGNLYMLYRAATRGVERDMFLLGSGDKGKSFTGMSLQAWPTQNCPMSSEALADTPSGVLAAWETKGQVAFARIDPKTMRPASAISPAGPGGSRKHPAVAADASGNIVLAWTEGTGWQMGGSLVWQVFDRSGKPTEQRGRVDGGIPVWGLPAVVALADGGFTIVH
jgi:hypothetical protein